MDTTVPRGQPLSYLMLQESRVFTYFGHGQDICVDNRLDLQVVPEGSAQIASVQCGRLAWTTLELEQMLSISDIQRLLRKERMTRFRDQEGTSNFLRPSNQNVTGQARIRKISVHLEGETQVNNYFQPQNDDEYNIQKEFGVSGFDKNFLYVQKAGLYTLAYIKSASFNEFNKNVNGLSILDAITWQLEGAAQPPANLVRNFLLNSNDPGMPDLNTILVQNDQMDLLSEWQTFVGRRFRQPAKELMNMFPGIHLNGLCRYVVPGCESAAQERRTVSPA